MRQLSANSAAAPVTTRSAIEQLEANVARHFAERADGWPVGPLLLGRGWSCSTPTVQIVEQAERAGAKRYVVLTLFPFRRTDQRHPPSPRLSLSRARHFAFERLRELAAPGALVLGPGPGIEHARGGEHLGLEVSL